MRIPISKPYTIHTGGQLQKPYTIHRIEFSADDQKDILHRETHPQKKNFNKNHTQEKKIQPTTTTPTLYLSHTQISKRIRIFEIFVNVQ